MIHLYDIFIEYANRCYHISYGTVSVFLAPLFSYSFAFEVPLHYFVLSRVLTTSLCIKYDN